MVTRRRVASEMSRRRSAYSVYLTKSSEKIARTALCVESIRREVSEPIKDFKASRANGPVSLSTPRRKFREKITRHSWR